MKQNYADSVVCIVSNVTIIEKYAYLSFGSAVLRV